MVDRPKFVEIDESERFAFIVTYLIRNPSRKTVLITATHKQKEFFTATLQHFDIKPERIHVQLIDEIDKDTLNEFEDGLLLDVPVNFQLLAHLYECFQKKSLILVLLHINNAYIRMLRNKYPTIDIVKLKFNHHKLLSVQGKLTKLIETSYHINRMAFYAYGSYLQYYHQNLLKTIFKTEELDVRKVALSYGFTVPPRVKMESAVFLTKKAQDKMKREKKIKKMIKKKQQTKQLVEQEAPIPNPILKPRKKIKSLKKQ